jgi:hypothetical protein
MNTSHTPESDAAEIVQTFKGLPESRTGRVHIDFARKLEQERDGWREAANSLAEAIPASWEELQPPAEQLRKYKEMIALQHEKYKSIL